ncbi:MAG: TVP38/TMEM64 family protein [Cyanobacteria bacterium SID2]|nr:TVP38/TMEM64 family protein [Cyanobacteria bacterium SID2]MBP0006055.1 TVP38/TMEM64 family protein [Cyanobacteria bacterium SBC]
MKFKLTPKSAFALVLVLCIALTAVGAYWLGGLDAETVQLWLDRAGIWAPIVYILLYTFGTLLLLPSTPLNLSGGAIFGAWWGTLWTSVGAVIAAIAAFAFTRTVGRNWVAQRMAGRWQAMDAEIRHGGTFYMFAIRLLPIIPYGLVNFTAGLTGIRFRDYLLGTASGTIPGVFPFVLLGSSGLKALQTGDVLPLLSALSLSAILVGGATWYRHHRRSR